MELYATADNNVIHRDTRYIHPVTGEVYGGTDYDDPAKLAEMGAVPLRIENAPEGFDALTWEIVDDPLPLGPGKLQRPLTTTPWVITDAGRAEKNGLINYSRANKLETLSITYIGWNFQADPDSRANLTSLLAAINAGIPVGETVAWRDADDAMRDLTPAHLVELAGVMLDAVTAVYQASWVKKEALAAITDPVAFRAFDTSL